MQAQTQQKEVKTTFQTSGKWKPVTDVRADATPHTFEVEPFLRLKVVKEPTVTDNKISVTVHIERGTSNAKYQSDITDVVLFVNNSSTYIGNNNYDSRVSKFISGDEAKNALGHDP